MDILQLLSAFIIFLRHSVSWRNLDKLLHATLQRHWSVRPSPGGPRLRLRQRQRQGPRRAHRLQPRPRLGLPVPALITRPTRRTISVRTTRTAEQDRTRNSVSGTIITKTTISSSVSCFFLWQSLFYPKLLLKFTHSMHIRRLDALLTSTGLTRSTVLRLSRDLSTWI